MPTYHLCIHGKVQGVYYRASAKEQADRLSLTGWVQNKASGTVEITITGALPLLEEFINWCKQGPGGAQVTRVEVNAVADKLYPSFEIRR